MKKYIKAKELLESNANKKEKKPIYATRKLSIGLVSCMLGLVMATPVVNAEEANLNHPQQVQEENQPADNGVEDPDTNHAPVPLENDETSQEGPHKLETQDADVFEMSPEIMLNAVTKIDVKDPTVNPILYDDTAISGGSLAKYRDKVKKETIIATVHVTLRGKDGTVKANLSVTPTTGTTWKVDLPEGKKVEEGDTVTVYQQIGEDKSQEVTKTAQPSKASSVTLTMPTGEFWIEQYVANIVNADEKAEAIDLLKKANPDIAKDIKSVEFKITGVDPKVASYTVTYKDNSTTEEIPAPGLTVKKVTETSRSPEIDSITIVDNVIKGKLAGPGPFNGIKVQLIVNVNKDKAGQFCNENKCTFDKTSSTPVDVTVQDDGTFSYTLQAWDSLTLDQIVGVSVKEPHKFVSCSTTTVKPVTPEKTEVKDPRKLTGKDKEAIDAAIRKAYTLDGVSKLPNGTGDRDGTPAVIQFDDSGNAKIFDGNDVAGTWDPNDGYKFKPEKNGDGSYKLKDGAQPKITIPAKDLVKNIKPDAPAVALSEDKKSITITPKKVDTDAKIITVSYKDKDGKDQTTTATKDDNGAWSISEGEGSVDQNGVVSLPKNKVKGETDVTAKVTDKGGIADDDTTPLTSEPGTLPVKETKADKVKALGGLDPVAIKKWVGDDVDWKKGVKAKDDAKKSEVEELLKDAKFEDVTEEKRSTSKEGDFKGKIKITFDDKSELVVEKQMLYVSNLVTSGKRENTPDDALVVEFKLGEGTKVDNTGSGAIEGNKDNPVSYQKYKVKPNTDLKTYKNQTLNETYYNLINTKVKAIDKYTEPVWNGENGSVTENFVITETNKVFTAKATKTCDITFDANKGGGSKDKVTQKVNTEYELPAANTFTAPENKQFSGWQIGEDSTLKQPGAKIKITGDTIVKAIWKPIELKVKFQTEAGASGTMEDKTVNKGSKYELPTPTFKPEEGKEFAGWKVGEGTELKAVGSEIDITGNVTLTAVWKDKKEEVKVSFKHGDGATGTMGDKIVNKGSKYELPTPTFKPEEGKEFAGWKVGEGTELKAVGSEIDITGNVTLTAVWKDKKEEVKVSFKHGDGATGTMGDKIVNKGSKYELPKPEFTPEEGKEFAGWKVGDGTELKQVGAEIDISGDVTLTAVWKDKKEEVKVSFKHGDGATGTMGDKIVNKGSKYELPKPEFTPEEGKEFAGWKVGDGTELKQVGAEIDISGDVTLTAVWKDKKEEVKVSFKHGDGATGTMGDKIVNKGSKYELPTPTFTPEEGKKFAGWKVGDSTELKQAKEKIDISGDVTLTAVWEDKPSNPGGNSGGYTPGGGGSIFTPSKPDKKPEDKKTGDEKPVDPNKPGEEKPNTPSEKNPEKPGEKEPGKEKDKNEEGKKPGVEDRLRIRYNPNGGHWNDNSTDIITYYYDRGNIITLINPPTREGYRFLYWKGSAYQPGDKYTVVDDHMFVAQWEKIGTKASRSNPKTGIESVAGVVCTLIASTGALYIGRKKED